MSITTVNPATQTPLQTYPLMGADQVQVALARGQHAFETQWCDMPLEERGRIITTFAAYLETHTDELATLMADEMGKCVTEGRAEVAKSVAVLRAVACRAKQYFTIGREADLEFDHDGLDVLIDIQPIGGLLAVMPWNFPVWQIMRVFAPNAVGGNVVYLKHAANVTGTALRLAELWEESGGVAGVFQTLVVSHDQVAELLADYRIQGVTLTGSELAGRSVAALAGANGKKSVLELGGSDPFVITEDADLDEAVRTLVTARFSNCGQVCTAAKRTIIAQPVYAEVRDRLIVAMNELVIGDPHDEATQLGPMVSTAIRDEVVDQLKRGTVAGATIIAGGQPINRAGAWMQPTLVDVIDPANPLATEEVFGPVLVLMAGRDEDHLVELANATPFGLGATVFAGDTERGLALARRIKSGMVAINAQNLSHPIVPFGGIKASGYGRELGPWGAIEFMNIRTVSVRR